LTLRATPVSLVFVTVAVNVCAFPKITAEPAGATVTAIAPGTLGGVAGIGVGVTNPAPTEAHPCDHTVPTARMKSGKA
jgi:hypothetical protein